MSKENETKPLSQEEFAKKQAEFVKLQDKFAGQQEELVKQRDKFADEQEESAKKTDKKVTIDKNGQEIRPTFKDSELSKHVPKDSLFNKLHHYNSGTVKSAINVTNKVEYFNFHYMGKKYTFWKGLALTKSQVKAMPKGYVKQICG